MQRVGRTQISSSVLIVMGAAGGGSILLFVAAQPDYPQLHTTLDAAAAMASSVLAVLLWDMGTRFANAFPRWLSLSFAVTAVLEAIHVAVTFGWTGVMAPITAAQDILRPSTWPPAAHVLPVGIATAVLLFHGNVKRARWFGVAVALLAAGLLGVFNVVPRYTSPTWLGITRPYLAAAPVLWGVVAIITWRFRNAFRLAFILSVSALIMVLALIAMLYSTAPSDTPAMLAHVGKLAAYLTILVSLMHLAASDMAALAEAERTLADANQGLERRVHERTEALVASESLFRAVIENSADGITLIARDGRVTFRSRSGNRLLGLADGVPLGHSFLERVHADDAATLKKTLSVVTAEPAAIRTIAVRAQHVDGTWHTFEARLVNLLDDPHIASIVVNYHDITLRLRAEQAAREGDERFREMAEHIKEAFFIVDITTGRTLYISPPWSEIWGRPQEEGYDPNVWLEAVHADDRPKLAAALTAVKEGKDDDTVFRIIRPDGAVRWARGRAYPVRNAAGDVYRLVGVTEDITELRSAENRFTQAQKMEAVGRLAGGVAHDFNNLLTVIIAETEMVQATLPTEGEGYEWLGEVLSASASAVGLTRQLLAFSRQQIIEPVVFDLNDSVADTSKMLRRLIGEDVRLELKLGADTGSVCADRGQMEQVLTNLAVNARDAMPQGGSLIVETALTTLDDDYVATRPDVKPGEYAVLIVSDTGTGMPEHVRAHAFEPFFTTKEQGKGTGLGLATCHGIVRQAGGHIGIYSEMGVGTTFRVYLPSVRRGAEPKAAETALAVGGTETILYVEDEAAVRRVGGRILRSLGYQVLEARDAVEALHLLNTFDGMVHLLLTDVVLPGIGGRELAERVRLARKNIKILFASGYTDDVVLQHQLIARDVAMLTKPFNRVSVAQKVRAVLDG